MTNPSSSSDAVAFEGPDFGTTNDDDDFDATDEYDGADDDLDQVANGDGANRVEGGAARAVLEHIAKSIVDDPDAVHVDVEPARAGVKLSLHVAPGDMGRIIGKRGRVAQAVRALVRAAAVRDGSDASVDIVD